MLNYKLNNMKKNSLKITAIVGIVLLFTVSCGSENNHKTKEKENIAEIAENSSEKTIQLDTKGYELLLEKCTICHAEKPGRPKNGEMIAPPMMRVQEHYKPVYPEKDKFIEAVMSMVNNPLEENVLMPGAVRKFNLMPKLPYDQEELKLIAEALFEVDFGGSHNKMNHKNSLELNNGEKWKLNKETIEEIKSVSIKLDNFKTDNFEDYNQFGKDIFNSTKKIMADKSYEGELFDQVHAFFGGIETNMHQLMTVKTTAEGEKQVEELKIKFKQFNTFFE